MNISFNMDKDYKILLQANGMKELVTVAATATAAAAVIVGVFVVVVIHTSYKNFYAQ